MHVDLHGRHALVVPPFDVEHQRVERSAARHLRLGLGLL